MTVRNPHLSTAGRLVSEFLKKQNVALTHMQCLELAAIAQGYKNAQHATQVLGTQEPLNQASLQVGPKKHLAYLLLGNTDSYAWGDATTAVQKMAVLKNAVIEEFSTMEERDAYVRGLTDGTEWNRAEVVLEDEYAQIQSEAGGRLDCVAWAHISLGVPMAPEQYLQLLEALNIQAASKEEQVMAVGALFPVELGVAASADDALLLATHQAASHVGGFPLDMYEMRYNLQTKQLDYKTWLKVDFAVLNANLTPQDVVEKLFIKAVQTPYVENTPQHQVLHQELLTAVLGN